MRVTVNGDDFGWSKSCTYAILEAYKKSYIQTTTMICTGFFFNDAITLIQDSSIKESIGIHFNLTEGTPLTQEIKKDAYFCDRNGDFLINKNRYKALTIEQKRLVYNELKAQADRFRETGLPFHHADSHHHIHTAPFIFPIVMRVAQEYGIKKIRACRNYGIIYPEKRIGKEMYNCRLTMRDSRYTKFFGSVDDYILVSKKKKTDDTIEIMVHPDYDENGVLVDRNGEASYDMPYGDPLSGLIEEIKKRGDKLY